MILSYIIPAFLPAVPVMYIVLKRQIPVKFLVAACFAAAFAILAAVGLQHVLHFFFDILPQSGAVKLLFTSFITAAFIEEGSKAAVFAFTVFLPFIRGASADGRPLMQNIRYGTVKRYVPCRRLILLALLFGFVFAGFENIFYNLRYPQFRLLRLCTASVLHGTLGSFYVRMLQAKTAKHAAVFLSAAVLLHGLYNLFTAIGGVFLIPAAATAGASCLFTAQSLRAATE